MTVRLHGSAGVLRIGTWCSSAIVVCLWLTAVSVSVHAQTPENSGRSSVGMSKIRAEVDALTLPQRSNAPGSIIVTLTPTRDDQALLEGKLRIAAYPESSPARPENLLFTLQSDSLVVTGQPFRLMIPVIFSTASFRQVDLYCQFETANGVIDLSDFPLRVPSDTRRSMVIGIPRQLPGSAGPQLQAVVDTFRFEDFDPVKGEQSITTHNVYPRVADISTDVVAYCNYDIVMLMDEGFAQCRESQLTAIRQWVNAGGSLLVAIPPNVVGYHVDFLNSLLHPAKPAEQTAAPPTEKPLDAPLDTPLDAPLDVSTDSPADPETRFGIGPDGALLFPTQHPGLIPATEAGVELPVFRLRYGLGRVVLTRPAEQLRRDEIATWLKSTRWRSVVAWLWRLKTIQLKTFNETGRWSDELGKPDEAAINNIVQYGDYQSQLMYRRQLAEMTNNRLSVREFRAASQIEWHLFPRNVRLIPFEIVTMILVLYVLLIGPVDWLLLGALKARKYTWILFPTVTLAVAMFTVRLSDYYQTFEEKRRSLHIADIGADATIARETVFDLLFTTAFQTVVTDGNGGMITCIDPGEWRSASQDYAGAVNLPNSGTSNLVAAPLYTGRLPANYTVAQQIPRTTPRINRQFRMGNFVTPQLALDWEALRVRPPEGSNGVIDANWFSDSEWQARVLEDVQVACQPILPDLKAYDPRLDIFIVHGSRLQLISRTGTVLASMRTPRNTSKNRGFIFMGQYGTLDLDPDLVRDTTIFPTEGLFRIVGQLSPSGGPLFEDLPILDPTDQSSYVLGVALRNDEQTFVYRKLYPGTAE